MLFNAGYTGFMVYMVPNALATGLTPKEASFLTTAFGAGNFAGLFLGAFFARFQERTVYVAIMLVSFVISILIAVSPLILHCFIGQFVIVFAIGAGIYCLIMTVAVLSRKLPFGDESVGVLYGWMAFTSGVSSSAGDVFIGA